MDADTDIERQAAKHARNAIAKLVARADPTRDARAVVTQLYELAPSRMKRYFAHALERVDFDHFADLQSRHLASPKPSYMVKYLDLGRALHRGYRDAVTLGLTRTKGLNILDLGCGLGTFGFACRYLSHNALGLDMHSPLIDDVTRLLGVVKLTHTIEPMAPLPPIHGFDLITAFRAGFVQSKRRRERYTVEEWEFLLDDLRARLNPRGSIKLQLTSLDKLGGLRVESEKFAELIAHFGGAFETKNRVVAIAKV